MNYNVYLFVCLLKIYDKKFKKLEYDRQFQKAPKLYEEFALSVFNDTTKSEYDCIIAYLRHKYPNKDKEVIIKKIKAINKVWGSFTTADIEASCDISIPTKDNLVHLANVFNYSHADVEVYENGGENEIDSYTLSYWDMDIDTLNEVLLYAESWEAECLQEEDRLS